VVFTCDILAKRGEAEEEIRSITSTFLPHQEEGALKIRPLEEGDGLRLTLPPIEEGGGGGGWTELDLLPIEGGGPSISLPPVEEGGAQSLTLPPVEEGSGPRFSLRPVEEDRLSFILPLIEEGSI
jgi:hypothetical protein